MILVHGYRLVRDVVLLGGRTGRWWIVLVMPALWLAALAVAVTNVVVTPAIYVFL